VYQSDASLTGFAFGGSIANPSDVARVGRIREKQRYKRSPDAVLARRHALNPVAEFVMRDPQDVDILGSINGLTPDWDTFRCPQDLASPGWSSASDFPEVTLNLLSRRQWVLFKVGQFKHAEDIMLLEARALLSAVQHAVGYIPGTRVLFLVDNLGLALVLPKEEPRVFVC